MNLTTDEIKNYSKKLLKSRFRILTNYEFYGSLLMNTKFSLDESCETAYTNGKTIAFDPKFLDSLTEYELDFVMMHEIMHICLKHCFRGEKKDNLLFNIACDIVVNSNIINSCKLNVKKLSKGALGEIMHLTPKNDEGYLYTAEEVYNLLHNVNSSTIDDHSHWVGDDENSDKATNELIDEWNNLIINTVESCGNKAHGCVPFGAGRQYDLLTKSIVNWKQLLNDFLTFEITDYSNVNVLAKNATKNSIIIIEKEVYDYYKDSILKDYSIRYISSVKLNNTFLLNNNNEAFNKLFDFYLSTLSSNEVKNESVVGVIETLKNNRVFNFIISNLIYIVIVILLIAFIIYLVSMKVLNDKKSKKEDRLYYFDAMTNLKNRNYLNDNIDFWSSTKVYPQAIIAIDINGLKILNDKDGHEAGDNQIKAVASVLIKTQRDNSEIMRTDGDEFMIYLVGYDEKKIGTYIHKLNRELISSLPNKDYGVSIGYSMIMNEQTTIDDAINDALLMINKSKESIK